MIEHLATCPSNTGGTCSPACGADPVGDPGLVQAGGYCAPSEPLIAEAELPTITVQRGGLKFPEVDPNAVRSLEGFKVYQQERTKRAAAVQSTIRGVALMLLILIVLLAVGDALPWQ